MSHVARWSNCIRRRRLLAFLVLGVFVAAGWAAVLHESLETEDHCDNHGHCVLCHGSMALAALQATPDGPGQGLPLAGRVDAAPDEQARAPIRVAAGARAPPLG